jgi:hypothetical protein
MIVADIAQEILALAVALFVVRWVQGKLDSESATAKALAYIFH